VNDDDDVEGVEYKDASIKGNSKFYIYFQDIRREVEYEIGELISPKEAELNPFHCEKFVNHLEEKFMAYFFVWGSLALKNTEWTRMNNGILEKHQGFIKKKVDKDVLPHKHLIANYSTVNGLSNDYLSSVAKQGTIKKTQTISNKRKIETITDDGGFEEKTPGEALECWSKPRQSYEVGQKAIPSYQNKANIANVETKCVLKKSKKTENAYQFSRFELTDLHFKNLDSKGTTQKAWLHELTIVAYLEMDSPSVYVMEGIHTLKIFAKNEEVLPKVT